MLTVGSIFEGKAIDVDYLGQGIVKHDDLVIFVKGLLTDEVAKIKIKTLKKRFAEGSIVAIIEESNQRRIHKDTYLGSMDLLHMSDAMQLEWQSKLTKDTLMKIAHIETSIEPIITDGRYFNYRNKSVFHVMNQDFLTLGLYHEDGRGLVEIHSFLLADNITNRIIAKLSEAHIRVDHEILKQVAIRSNQENQALVTLIAVMPSFKGLNQIVTLLKQMKEVIGVTLNIKNDYRKILGSTSHLLWGQNTIDETLGTHHYPVTDQSFFQVNLPVIQKAYDIIKAHILSDSKVIDAYSGVGSIGYYVLDKIQDVTMIESNPDAVLMAKQIKEKYHLQKANIVFGQAELIIDQYKADVLVVDPPRNGLMPLLVQKMIEKPYKQIFYMSCDIKTLARDLGLLEEVYQIQKVYPIRMFPQTTECETLVILTKKQQSA